VHTPPKPQPGTSVSSSAHGAKAILIRCETVSNPYWIGLLRVESNGCKLAWHSLGWPVVLAGTITYLPQQSKISLFCWLCTLSLHKSFCKWRNIYICQTVWVSVSWILSQWSWKFDTIPYVSISSSAFLLSVQLTYLYWLLGCKGP